MKIKQKKQLNLPQLIEWAMDNDIKRRVFVSNPNFNGVTYKLSFDIDGDLYFEEPLTPTLLFTVEVEEVVDEDTKFRHIVFIDDCGLSASWGNSSINDIKYGKDKEFHAYIDGEFKLIWRDGKLVE